MAKTKIMRRLAIGAAIAGAVGYLAGIITAPKSGRETRKELNKAVDSNMREVEKQLKQMHSELGKLVDDAKIQKGDLSGKAQKELQALVGKAKDSKLKMSEVLSAVHEGEANDKDLKKAISDAKHAIAHIKDFIQK
jgi:gas vesicle protein